jgi:RHS repeat-associated protein
LSIAGLEENASSFNYYDMTGPDAGIQYGNQTYGQFAAAYPTSVAVTLAETNGAYVGDAHVLSTTLLTAKFYASDVDWQDNTLVHELRAQHMSYNSDLVGFDATYGWDTEGRMTSINYGPQYQMTYDVNGRLGGMSGSDLNVTASYGVAGEMLGFSYGGSTNFDHYSETRTYNAMLQLTRATVTGTSFSMQMTPQTAMDMQYIYTAGQNNGRIVQSIDGVAGETVNYTYDALNRLATAGATNGTWGQAFAYDGFGNLTGKTVTQGSAPTLSVSFDPLTNHQNGQSYDANGNPTGMYLRYDVENRMTQGPGGYYAYDHAGKRVKKTVTGAEEFYFYGIGGQRLATTVCTGEDDGTGCQPRVYDVYFGGKLVKSRGAVVATDRLGSVRASSNGDRMTYYPYGEERTSTADGRDKFGTYMRDSVTQDYADQRYYGVGTGRFNVPDPSTGVNPRNPATWNKYAYVAGDPINFYDPSGLMAAPSDVAVCGPGWIQDASLEGPCSWDAPLGNGVPISPRTLGELAIQEAIQGLGSAVSGWQWANPDTSAVRITLSASAWGYVSDLVPAGGVVIVAGGPATATAVTVVVSAIALYKIYQWLSARQTYPGKTPSQWQDDITDPKKGWRTVEGDPTTWERDCPPGSPRTFETVHYDEGIKYGEGVHYDYTDCQGKTWKDYPDGTRNPARP